MRAKARLTAMAVALLCASMAGLPQAPAGAGQSGRKAAAAPAAEARVDINRATVDELLKVPGMTRSWAERIVRFRPYRTKQDLVEKGVLSSEVYDRIKDFVIAHREKQ